MTPNQKTLYFRLWGQACYNHGWRMAKGRMIGMEVDGFGATEDLDELYHQVWSEARALALAGAGLGGKLTPDHFRHACHRVATGADKSSQDLSNRELDRVFCLFKILADPDGALDAIVHYFNPANGDRKRWLWFIENKCVQGYVANVCREKFGTTDWNSLTTEGVKELFLTMKNRPNGWKEKRKAENRKQKAENETETEPF